MKTREYTPSILGTGLVCLDIIRKENEIFYMNGGSCGNVISILSFLGWDSSIIKPKFNDAIEEMLVKNLKMLNVDIIEYGHKKSNTPRIIQDILIESGRVNHKFLTECPSCGKELPKNKLINKTEATDLFLNINDFDVFYTDRASSGIEYLRNQLNRKGTWTVYEPNSCRNIRSLLQCSLESKIVKFSSQRIPLSIADKIRSLASHSEITLIVVTLGKNGLYFSYKQENDIMTDWIHMDALPVVKLVDSAGAGDWCTAGFLYKLISKHHAAQVYLTYEEIVNSLRFGQSLSSFACSEIGAQGLFYSQNVTYIEKLMDKEFSLNIKSVKPNQVPKIEYSTLCPTCLQAESVYLDEKIS